MNTKKYTDNRDGKFDIVYCVDCGKELTEYDDAFFDHDYEQLFTSCCNAELVNGTGHVMYYSCID